MSRYEGICFLSKCLIFWQLTKFDYLMPLWGISFPCLSFDILYYWKIECLVKPNFHFRTCVYNTFIYFPKRTNRMSNTSTVKLKKNTKWRFLLLFLGVNYHRFLKKWNISIIHIERIYDIQTSIVYFLIYSSGPGQWRNAWGGKPHVSLWIGLSWEHAVLIFGTQRDGPRDLPLSCGDRASIRIQSWHSQNQVVWCP